MSTRTKRSGATSRHRGVSFDKRTKSWRAQVWTRGRQLYVGSYKTEAIAAARARLAFRAYA